MSLKEGLDKAKMIAEAITSETPTGKKWFEERMEICNACEYNSANVLKEKRKMGHSIHEGKCFTATFGKSGNFCTACTCCIELKASIKRSTCGLTDLGLQPKWLALEAEAPSSVSVFSVDGYDYPISYEDAKFVINLGATNQEIINFKFGLFVPTKYTFTGSRVSCGCTFATHIDIDEARKEFSIRLNTAGFSFENVTSRELFVQYGNKEITIKFKVQKTK
jgi:hypothetical protein